MARRNTDPAQAEATEPQGENVETEQSTTEPTEPTEAPIDLTAFQAAVQASVEQKNAEDGQVPEETIVSVNEAYRALDGIKAKNAAKTWVEEQVKTAIMPPNLDAVTARAYTMIRDNLSAGGTKVEKAPADPAQAYAERQAALRLASSLIALPEGVDSDAASAKIAELVSGAEPSIKAYQEWLALVPEEGTEKPSAPEISPLVRLAFKLSTGKTSGASGSRKSTVVSSGVRRSVEKHIAEFLATKEVGDFATVNDIATFKSNEYGGDFPSSGAVSARLFPDSGKPTSVAGLEAVPASEGRPRGVRKIA